MFIPGWPDGSVTVARLPNHSASVQDQGTSVATKTHPWGTTEKYTVVSRQITVCSTYVIFPARTFDIIWSQVIFSVKNIKDFHLFRSRESNWVQSCTALSKTGSTGWVLSGTLLSPRDSHESNHIYFTLANSQYFVHYFQWEEKWEFPALLLSSFNKIWLSYVHIMRIRKYKIVCDYTVDCLGQLWVNQDFSSKIMGLNSLVNTDPATIREQ